MPEYSRLSVSTLSASSTWTKGSRPSPWAEPSKPTVSVPALLQMYLNVKYKTLVTGSGFLTSTFAWRMPLFFIRKMLRPSKLTIPATFSFWAYRFRLNISSLPPAVYARITFSRFHPSMFSVKLAFFRKLSFSDMLYVLFCMSTRKRFSIISRRVCIFSPFLKWNSPIAYKF